MHTSTPKVLCFAVLSLLAASSLVAKPDPSDSAPWTFVSIPDFLNFDIEYPQKGWEDALGFIVGSMKKEDPAFAMVAGDLVMGHWGTKKEEIDRVGGQVTIPAGSNASRITSSRSTPPSVTTRSRDNPWRGAAGRMRYPFTRMLFKSTPQDAPQRPRPHEGGPRSTGSTRMPLFVSVDVFEKGKSKQGEIAAGVTGKQLEWFEKVLSEHGPKVDHIVVMGHTPILRPVRTFSSSGMLTVKGRDSDFWKSWQAWRRPLSLRGSARGDLHPARRYPANRSRGPDRSHHQAQLPACNGP